jgi:hypothetical protein
MATRPNPPDPSALAARGGGKQCHELQRILEGRRRRAERATAGLGGDPMRFEAVYRQRCGA